MLVAWEIVAPPSNDGRSSFHQHLSVSISNGRSRSLHPCVRRGRTGPSHRARVGGAHRASHSIVQLRRLTVYRPHPGRVTAATLRCRTLKSLGTLYRADGCLVRAAPVHWPPDQCPVSAAPHIRQGQTFTAVLPTRHIQLLFRAPDYETPFANVTYGTNAFHNISYLSS